MDKILDFSRCILLAEEKKEVFSAFYRLLLEYNAKYNLTAITEEKEVLYKHFVDSLAGEQLIGKGARVLEVGSGAGFPSIPLMLVREDITFTLVESTGKKCEFLRVAARELHLNAEVINARAEELAKNSAHRERYDVCCARAVARLNTLAEYCLPFVKVGGKFLAYKGDAGEEMQEAQTALKVLGGGESELYRGELPCGYGARSLVCVKKVKSTPEKYPRGQGKERSKPL